MAAGLKDRAKVVECDSSATVTVVMKDGEKLDLDQVTAMFAASPKGKAWKPASFSKEARLPAVVRYEVKYSGGT